MCARYPRRIQLDFERTRRSGATTRTRQWTCTTMMEDDDDPDEKDKLMKKITLMKDII
jgi:hypothetical protein